MNNNKNIPPRLPQRILQWFLREDLAEEVLGDLDEKFYRTRHTQSTTKAKLNYWYQVLHYFRPFALKNYRSNSNYMIMYKNYFKIGWRNLNKQKGYSFINIGGLAIGMAVSMLVGLWIWDEVSYNKNHQDSDRIAAVMQHGTFADGIDTWWSQSYQLGNELRNNYGSYFEHVVMSTFTQSPILTYEDKALTKTGYFMEPSGPDLLSLTMLSGTHSGLQDHNSILLSQSSAVALFGSKDAIGKQLRIDNQLDVTVRGVYEDLPENSSFNDMLFVAPLELFVRNSDNNLGWVNNWLAVYVKLADNVNMEQASMAIKDAKLNNVGESIAKFKPELFLHPLSKWRLYSSFENGQNAGGYIDLVRLLGIIGAFMMLLACINFMNLSTARSEKRAKEVGVRKVVGSHRNQLILQFITESFLTVLLAFISSLLIVQLALPWFNLLADKNISIAWASQTFWLFSLSIIVITTLLAGSYPALFLSAFRPIKALKGTFRTGRSTSVARKTLVVVQFAVSITLILGTIVVYNQIQFVKDRPLGYDQNGLITLPIKTEEVKEHFEPFKRDLLASSFVSEVSRSESMVTNMYWSDYGLEWQGKDPEMQDNIYRGAVDFEFGKTVDWKIKAGRDFSRDMPSDSSAMILNEAAVEYMGFENPIGEQVRLYGRTYTVIGVVKNMVSQSIYNPIQQTFYIIEPFDRLAYINIKINPESNVNKAIYEVESIFKKYNASTPFDFIFADEKVAEKFGLEARIGKLAGISALLTVFISCLGLFGLSTYIAEQRTREISIRKTLGASLLQLWQLLSREFVLLVSISCLIATPLAYLLMEGWLQFYDYRTEISWWIFTLAIFGALLITLCTVSYQTIKAALVNPADKLRSE